ncbi:hypothetical protein BaRGS_00012947 [Batillaria attramentaria]|uniref:PiggyBac transposable element-derived protein domain-containing protein n=1 Tax=Batillaria attramentaria TaxID=370345 RepID=A0ABD0L8N0_9CAEN
MASRHEQLDSGGTVLCVKYKDKKDLYLLSTVHEGKVVETGKTDRRTNQPVRKPDVVQHYNSNMNAVDQFDQHLS